MHACIMHACLHACVYAYMHVVSCPASVYHSMIGHMLARTMSRRNTIESGTWHTTNTSDNRRCGALVVALDLDVCDACPPPLKPNHNLCIHVSASGVVSHYYYGGARSHVEVHAARCHRKACVSVVLVLLIGFRYTMHRDWLGINTSYQTCAFIIHRSA